MTYMSTAERLVKLHDTMCDNIEAMGGTVDPTGTLIEIADAILDIPPVPVGVSIDTATTCSADKATTTVSSPVTFTGKVSAYHDDETSANVDLIGYLKGATVKFYNGQTLLGSTTTDNNGEYSFSYTPLVAGEMSVIAMFEAIEDYKQSSSTAVVITVSSYSDIVMSADKPILSYADHEKATLYAQLVDDNDTPLEIEGVTLTFKKDSTILGTANTDSTGLATLVDGYTSQGVGDVTLSVTDGTFLTKTFAVQDCVDVITGETDQSSKFGSSIGLRNSGTSSTSYDSTNKQYIVNITKANSESFIPLNNATGLDDVVIEFDGMVISSSPSFIGLCFHKENSNWGRLGTKFAGGGVYEYGGNTNGTYAETDITGSTPPSNTWLHHKFTITNDTVHRQVYNGSTLIYEDTRTYTGFFTSNTKYGFSALWTTNWKGYYKNIKIKPL